MCVHLLWSSESWTEWWYCKRFSQRTFQCPFSPMVFISFYLFSTVDMVSLDCVSFSAKKKKQLPNTRSSCVYLVHDKVNDIIWCPFSSLLRALLSSSFYKQIPDVSFDLKWKGHCEYFLGKSGLDVNKMTKWFHLLGVSSGAHLLCSFSLWESKHVNPLLPLLN